MSSTTPESKAARLACWAGLAAVIALVLALIGPTLATVRHQPQADEGFYLAYSQAGFASGYLDVSQLTFTREDR